MAFFPILTRSSMYVCTSVELVYKGGILGVWISCNALLFGSL